MDKISRSDGHPTPLQVLAANIVNKWDSNPVQVMAANIVNKWHPNPLQVMAANIVNNTRNSILLCA